MAEATQSINHVQTNQSSPRATNQTKQSPNSQSQGTPQKVLSGLFTKEFLSNVKNELTKKKSPRNKQYFKLDQFTQLSQYKAQIQKLQKRNRELTQQNMEMRFRLGEAERSQSQLSIDQKESNRSMYQIAKPRLKISSEVDLKIPAKDGQAKLQKLKEKVQYLQMYKVIKERRFEQLLQKSARYESQIMLLKAREQDLQSEVKNLRQAIKIHLTYMNGKPLQSTNITDKSTTDKSLNEKSEKRAIEKSEKNAIEKSLTQKRATWKSAAEKSQQQNGNIEDEHEAELPFQKQEINYMLNILDLRKKQSEDILQSQCKEIDVLDEISKKDTKKQIQKLQEFYQMDYMIEEELPNLTKISEELKFNMKFKANENSKLGKENEKIYEKIDDLGGSIRQSQVFIDLDSSGVNPRKQLEQSLIEIQVNSPLPFVQTIQRCQSIQYKPQKLNQSLVNINLNDL